MRERLFEIECPHCNHVFMLKRDTILIEGMDRNLEDRLFDGSYFMHRCNKCDTIITVFHPFLFRKPRAYSLVLSRNDQMEQFEEDELFYRCTDPAAFIEFYRALHYGIDPFLVQALKERLHRQRSGRIEFESYDPERGLFWFWNDGRLIAIKNTKEIV